MISKKPNLLFILSDQHNPSVLGCAGDQTGVTPNLDRLADSGVMLQSAYCTAPLCTPSRMSMLTGQHPYQTRVWTNSDILDSAIPTYAHALGAAGYRPVHIGRMHSIGPDQHRGFVERYIGDLSSDYVGVGGERPDRGVLQHTSGPQRESLALSGAGQSGYEVYDEYVTVETIDQLNRIGVQRRSGQSTEPFCLTVGYVLPHAPFVARAADYERFAGKVGAPQHTEPFSEELHPFIQQWRTKCGIEEVSDEEVQRARTAYWALVSSMDAMIGRIITSLEENGLDENTIIVYMSDHGESIGENSLWWKHTFYEHSVRVPVIFSWPGTIPAGQTSDLVVSTIDVIATMLDAVSAENMPHSPGRSFLESLLKPEAATDWDNIAFSESCTDDGWFTRMVRKENWKLIYYHGFEPQLFDLATDPHELNDRAQDDACRDIRRQLQRLVLQDWDPERIALQMESRRKDSAMIANWVRAVGPKNQISFDLAPGPETYWLDDVSD